MNIWTTFCPSKASWELTYIYTKGELPTSDWQNNNELIDKSLKRLKAAGIFGIRLVIYPSELSVDGQNFNWKPIEKMLDKCFKLELAVDLCIGPFQYPNYPGIFLPNKMLNLIFDNKRCLDTTPQLWKYGMHFLKEQIGKYGNDVRIHGFHFANEWPDYQKVKGREKIRACISLAFMLEAADYLKKNTTKPILLNTNIDIYNKKKLVNSFAEIFNILGSQGNLGFDIYPSQVSWNRNPFQKLIYTIVPYSRFFKSVDKKFKLCKLYFAEVEAQPWGSGQSWHQLISQEPNPNQKVLLYTTESLLNTYNKFIKNTNCKNISLWGSEFWLSAYAMGIKWPLDQIKNIQ
jgi:hypothetical protein